MDESPPSRKQPGETPASTGTKGFVAAPSLLKTYLLQLTSGFMSVAQETLALQKLSIWKPDNSTPELPTGGERNAHFP